ncbi:leucine-rich repeat-containing G-protein coupled receptor 5-like [Bradysia coprophila]|uniref:leucine-rich repeat-containing G-protein coupled receptor 5-like n=1 Tax=Bradysia coprophila TaxID=38358 RepID=UPI00187D74A5|nr:leucine-rich repeat-containing G-protein coupled receptor 5-like [Bradysia coprophila]
MFRQTSFIILLALGLSNGIFLECDYALRSVGTIGNVYSCLARIHPSPGEKNVSDVSHNHLDGRVDADVESLILNDNIAFTPFNIQNFFPNLVAIDINGKGTLELTRESLKGLQSLRYFSFSRNQLQIIEPNLFIENPRIEWIYFDGNPIRHVAFNVFDHLEELRVLYMIETTCINEGANTDKNAVDLLKFRILVNCPPTFEMLEEKIVRSSLLQIIIAAQIDREIDPINEALEEIVEEQRLLIERVEALEESHRH